MKIKTNLYRPFGWFALIAWAAGPLALAAQQNSYTVSWLGIPVVDVSVVWQETDSVWSAEYRATSRDWFNRVYAVDNSYRIDMHPVTLRPLKFEKLIVENNNSSHFVTKYDTTAEKAIYANGLERHWRPDDMTLFSSLAWVERHAWMAGESDTFTVEIEGIFWAVEATCSAVTTTESGMELVQVGVTFLGIRSGEAVLSSTDIVTALLPGEKHFLRFTIDRIQRRIQDIRFGRIPFQVRATIN
ncbi:MAG: DUF3108 domain-containing protein [Candidatus Marinimicrobia bacterium]|nr:DUF3108 domain-containing protein [Candidatus Neomarinimicrobiota bacterium]